MKVAREIVRLGAGEPDYRVTLVGKHSRGGKTDSLTGAGDEGFHFLDKQLVDSCDS